MVRELIRGCHSSRVSFVIAPPDENEGLNLWLEIIYYESFRILMSTISWVVTGNGVTAVRQSGWEYRSASAMEEYWRDSSAR
jgi:hypothetical protein